MVHYLVQPPRGTRISGGYRYNQAMTSGSTALFLLEVAPANLESVLAKLAVGPEDWLLADSLFLSERLFGPFFEVRQRTRARLALVLHALPSFIERASARATPATDEPAPSREELELIRALDLVVCPGPYLARVLEASGCPTERVVCPPGSPPPRPSLEPHRGELRLLSVGNVTRVKGYELGLRALARLQDSAWRWDIVGSFEDPSYVSELEALGSELGLTARVSFLGGLAHHETLAQYQRCQLFCLPSLTENYPLVLLEAQAHALPVVAFAVGGVPDIVTHERDALLAATADPEAFAHQLRRFAEEPELLAAYGAAALSAASARPAWAEARRRFECALV